MKKIENLYQDITFLQKKLLNKIQPEVISSIDFTTAEKWHSSNEDLTFEQGDGEVIATNNSDIYIYFSYLETNLLFKRYPMFIIEAVPGEKFEFTIQLKVESEQVCKIAIIEYSPTAKVKATLFDPNKKNRLTVSQETTRLRLALRIPKRGMTRIQGCSFHRVFDKPKTAAIGRVGTSARPGLAEIASTKELRVAAIFDEFTRTCYEKEVQLLTFTPDDWREVLEREEPHVLMVESAWHGNHGAWTYKIGRYSGQDRGDLLELLDWCRQNDVPTIFWNKEDPIHYEKFIDTAKLFDYIYTTDADMIPKYQQAAGHTRVYAQSFAIQPKMHNPVKLYEKRMEKMCFAGSYYANRHEERRRDMDQLLDVAKQYGLVIYDRNFERQSPDFQFPERFLPDIAGSLAYNEMNIAYKGYTYMLNINSIKHSPTMFSRRVFEGLACGTPIISSYSKGIQRMFGDLVIIAETKEALAEKLRVITSDRALYERKAVEGVREVYHHHTYKHRLQMMLHNMDVILPEEKKEVTVISVVHSKDEIEAVVENFTRQAYPHKKLLLVASMFDGVTDLMNLYNTKEISVFTLPYLEREYRQLGEVITTPYISYMAGQHFYGEHYLADMMLATEYTEADVIGKQNYFKWSASRLHEVNEEMDNQFVTELHYHRALWKTQVIFQTRIKNLLAEMVQDASLSGYFRQGVTFFSADKFNFIEQGRGVPQTISKKVDI
ncbi:CgeB family protein [Listeria costaricensis]|uniref:CgeB family protein n=1 Tax=Listeria costaricensis TaxID=2026604 RepID=UPI000C0765EC|nr:glycosyltransferase [Listeria costaricensis]